MVLVLSCVSFSSAATVTFYLDTTATEEGVSVSTELVRAESVLLQVIADAPTTCRYSAFENIPYGSKEGSFDFMFQGIHKKTLVDLGDGVYTYYVQCKNESGYVSAELETVFSVNVPMHASVVLDEEPPIKAGRYKITVTTSKVASEPPSLGYSFNGVGYTTVPLFGSGTVWEGYMVIDNSIKEQVGSFKFSGKDLEGFVGTQISTGGLFIVDTLKPSTLVEFKAEGYAGRIQLDWYYEGEADSYLIYRSTSQGVRRSDLIETLTDESDSYADTSVTRGKTYYYRIGVVDEAGNEADLSPEIFATALLQNTTLTTQGGLEPRFLGLVDSYLADVQALFDEMDAIEVRAQTLDDEERDIFETMKLSREINSVRSELNSLQREGETLKTQSLTQVELDRKLNTNRLRLNALKQKIPETVRIDDSKTYERVSGEVAISEALLALYPSATQSQYEQALDFSLEASSEQSFSVLSSLYHVSVVYLDGSIKEYTFVEKSASLQAPQNYTLVERVPRSAVDINNLDLLTTNAVINSDAFAILFEEESLLHYVLEGHVSFASLDELSTALIYDPLTIVESESVSPLTGFVSFVQADAVSSYFGFIVGFILVAGLGVYWYNIRQDRMVEDSLISFRNRIAAIDELYSAGDIDAACSLYAGLSADYESLTRRAKKLVYIDLAQLHTLLGDAA